MRIEDHDRLRSRREYEAALLDDLDWLGFGAETGRQPLLRQSDETWDFWTLLDRWSHPACMSCLAGP